MKKLLTIGIATFAMFAVVSIQVFACDAEKSASKDAKASQIHSKASCSTADAEACMDKYGISKEECKALCDEIGKDFEFRHISVDGMTCGSCESAVKTALKDVDGVRKVVKVSYQDGMALVAVSKKAEDNMLTKAVSNKGFQAEIIPAVATTAQASSVKGKKACYKKGKTDGTSISSKSKCPGK